VSSDDAVDTYNGNTATQEGTPAALFSEYREFIPGNSEDFVHASNATLQTGDIDYTLAMQIYLYDTETVQTWLSKYGTNSNDEYGIFLEGNPDTTALFSFAIVDTLGSQTTLYATTFGQPTVNTLYNVAVWHDALNDEIGISVNGIVDTQVYTGGSLATNGPFRIGALGDTAGLFAHGKGKNVAFWKRVLSGVELVEYFDTGIPTAMMGFDGILPVGFMALMLEWSGVVGPEPPVFTAQSKIPLTRRRGSHGR
jgi:hypothetical protein